LKITLSFKIMKQMKQLILFLKVYQVFCSQMATKQLITHILSVDKYIYHLIEINKTHMQKTP